MDKQKQIEEMAEIALKNTLSYTCAKQIAMNFYNAGYRKLDDHAIMVLRKAKDMEERIRKETAEKFAERLKAELTDIIPFEDYEVADWNYDGMDIENSIDEICKEIKEGKNE